jgi:hypothetical protein
MSKLFVRSPRIIKINEASQTGARVKIYIWNEGGSAPAQPNYTLSKLISSSNEPACYFDIAPYINEFINHDNFAVNKVTEPLSLDVDQYCYVTVKTYDLNAGVYTLNTTTTYTAHYGYVDQKDGINLDLGNYFLDEGTYYYHYDSNYTHLTLPVGDLVVNNTSGWKYKYTDLVTGSTRTYTSTTSEFLQPFRVYSSYWSNGNKLEITTNAGTVLKTYYFKPKEECKHTPVIVDFVNKYGAWQREFLFKASFDSLEITNQNQKSFRVDPSSFDEFESTSKTFNTNGNESIKCNSGFVDEFFKGTLRQLAMSERILVNGRPAELKTKQFDLQKNINNRLINYVIEFNYSNPII